MSDKNIVDYVIALAKDSNKIDRIYEGLEAFDFPKCE